jgi:hypothetical protein
MIESYSPLPIEMIDVNQACRSIINTVKAGVLKDLGANFWNVGKTKEIKQRVLHL